MLHAYVGGTCRIGNELLDSMDEGDIAALRADLTMFGESGWRAWRGENRKEIVAYVKSPPSARNRKKSWQDPKKRRLLSFAGFQHSFLALHLLIAVDSMDITPGRSYRDMVIAAEEAYMRSMVMNDENVWPFDPPAPLGWPLISEAYGTLHWFERYRYESVFGPK